MEEAAESQMKICQIHYKQMDKSDRDTPGHARRRRMPQLLVQFPNSKFVPEAQQLLRNIQESLGEGEYEVGNFYHKRGDNSARPTGSATRGSVSALQQSRPGPLDIGDSYGKMGNRFRKQKGEAYASRARLSLLATMPTRPRESLRKWKCQFPSPTLSPLRACNMKGSSQKAWSHWRVTHGSSAVRT